MNADDLVIIRENKNILLMIVVCVNNIATDYSQTISLSKTKVEDFFGVNNVTTYIVMDDIRVEGVYQISSM